jgi:hypothetical protein
MRNLYIPSILLIILFVLSGCATFKVEDTSGIKSMLDNKIKDESLASKIKAEYGGSDKDKIMELYEKAYLANNAWVAKIQLDIQTKDTLKVSEDDYLKTEAGLTSAEFIKTVGEPLPLLSTSKSLIEAAEIINKIINNLIKQNNIKVEEARKRIYEELEKSKWKELK